MRKFFVSYSYHTPSSTGREVAFGNKIVESEDLPFDSKESLEEFKYQLQGSTVVEVICIWEMK